MKQLFYISPIVQLQSVLAVTTASWQVKPAPARARSQSRQPILPRPPRRPQIDADRLDEALAHGWRWAV
ncbi:hypothetical protein [Variovorax sp. KK3]|uniref:hypothetical protein n=1 Tax=Variovorax sp. KK3 TaxID=1855728 RepID=UPI00117C0BAA|nr:hypothetical protein [Variovorax sp. KK3]